MGNRRQFLKSILGAPFFLGTPARAASLVRYPYLQNVGANQATLVWTTFEEGTGAVRYSSRRSSPQVRTAVMQEKVPAETQLEFTYYRHKVELRDLEPNTEYFYQVYCDEQSLTAGEEISFRTAGPGPFTFLALGDSGMGTKPQRELARLMTQERAALLVHTGDIAYPKGSFEEFERRHFDIYADMMKRVPFFPSPGNHEYWTANAGPYLAVHEAPTAGVPQADRGRYYSFDWGNVHFISLDSNTPLQAAARGRGDMLRWLEDDLRATTKFWKIPFFHHPPYAFGHNDNDALAALARQHMAPLFERYGVQLVLNGHEHSYQRSRPLRGGQVMEEGRGTLYVTTGGGGAGLYGVTPNPLIVTGRSEHHYVRVDVNGARLTLRAVNVNGEEIDRLVLAPQPALAGEALVNAASGAPQVAPGSLVSLFGSSLAPEEARAEGLPLPFELGGVSLTANGKPVPLLFASAGQVNGQLPYGLEGTVHLRVRTSNGEAEAWAPVVEAAPGAFAVAHSNGEPVTPESPARSGELLRVYATGLGPVDGQVPATGQPAGSSPLAAKLRVTVDVSGLLLMPAFAGLAPGQVGMYQVDFRLPSGLYDGQYSVRVYAGNLASNAVSLPVLAAQ